VDKHDAQPFKHFIQTKLFNRLYPKLQLFESHLFGPEISQKSQFIAQDLQFPSKSGVYVTAHSRQ